MRTSRHLLYGNASDQGESYEYADVDAPPERQTLEDNESSDGSSHVSHTKFNVKSPVPPPSDSLQREVEEEDAAVSLQQSRLLDRHKGVGIIKQIVGKAWLW
jgi:hypothetical protein